MTKTPSRHLKTDIMKTIIDTTTKKVTQTWFETYIDHNMRLVEVERSETFSYDWRNPDVFMNAFSTQVIPALRYNRDNTTIIK